MASGYGVKGQRDHKYRLASPLREQSRAVCFVSQETNVLAELVGWGGLRECSAFTQEVCTGRQIVVHGTRDAEWVCMDEISSYPRLRLPTLGTEPTQPLHRSRPRMSSAYLP